MKNFFYLEGAYLILGGIILLITLYVTTRPFMGKEAVKKGMLGVSLVLALMIAAHYRITTKRIDEVRRAFSQNMPVICESRMQRKVAQSVIIQRILRADRSLVFHRSCVKIIFYFPENISA